MVSPGCDPEWRYAIDIKGLFMQAAAEPPAGDRENGQPRTIGSDELFDGQSEVFIRHNGVQYRLRITRQDKLILTK
ncbi:hemin uptake protein HemP [Devosia sp. XGJD_8]|uniref:hemin uptake protein HemP n=1 Tax=Devosia sp. XGJD_8 TaxID=3391187 RepID=UPI00398530B8